VFHTNVRIPPPLVRFPDTFHGYVILYHTAEQKESILGVIRAHNALSKTSEFGDTNECVRMSEYDRYERLQAGAELVSVRAASLECKWAGMHFHNAILCCNTGGYARNYLDWEVCRALAEPVAEHFVHEIDGYSRFVDFILKKDLTPVEWFDQKEMVGEGKYSCESQPDVYTTRHDVHEHGHDAPPTKFEFHSEEKPGEILCDEFDLYCDPF
jgi:hypothetical protein